MWTIDIIQNSGRTDSDSRFEDVITFKFNNADDALCMANIVVGAETPERVGRRCDFKTSIAINYTAEEDENE